jgi:CRISPR-associated protein Cmr6
MTSKKIQKGLESNIPRRVLPLYDRGMADIMRHLGFRTSNSGLIFDRYANIWSGSEGQPPWKPENLKNQPSEKERLLKEVCQHLHSNETRLEGLLQNFHHRHKMLVASLGGIVIEVKTEWRFVSGIGMSHALGNGFVWDRNLGIPYLPGSSVKGSVRAWAERWHSDNPEVWEVSKTLFGDDKNLGVGEIIVFDAYPVSVPRLELDVMTVHYKEYYDKKLDVQKQPVPPADYLSPTPIFFLTVVPGTRYNFSLAPRIKNSTGKVSLDRAEKLLREALTTLGAGAKTAVGYGHFTS